MWSYSSLIKGCVQASDLDSALEVLQEMKQAKHVLPNEVCFMPPPKTPIPSPPFPPLGCMPCLLRAEMHDSCLLAQLCPALPMQTQCPLSASSLYCRLDSATMLGLPEISALFQNFSCLACHNMLACSADSFARHTAAFCRISMPGCPPDSNQGL